jgi:hypothetical protein
MIRGVVSEAVDGKRAISKAQAIALGKFFNVDTGLSIGKWRIFHLSCVIPFLESEVKRMSKLKIFQENANYSFSNCKFAKWQNL